MILPSPLETLAAFALAFLSGVAFGLGLCRYVRHVRKEAQRSLSPA